MEHLKLGQSLDGKPMHYSVGALIVQNGKYLLIDRVNPPFGFAGLAGHLEEGEDPDTAIVREVEEESGLTVLHQKLILEGEMAFGQCSRGVGVHYWHLYECEVAGEVKQDELEAKSIGWYTLDEIKRLTLEPVWEHCFRQLGIIS